MSMRLACVQANVAFGDPDANTANAVAKLRELKDQGVDLAVFPEAYLTGYCVSDDASARRIALGDFESSEPIETLRKTCDELDLLAVVGQNTVGRVQVSAEAKLLDSVRRLDVEGLLHSANSTRLFTELLHTYAASGISGVLPKFLTPETQALFRKGSLSTELHIVKVALSGSPSLP